MRALLPRLDSRTTLTDRVYEALRALILNGTLAPGQRITESEVAAQMGISITPVREAFLKLEAAGLLVIRPRQAAQVSMLSLAELEQYAMIRIALETALLDIVIERIGEEELHTIKSTLAIMRQLQQDGNWEAYARAHRQFHELLIEPAGCPIVKRMVMDVFDTAQRYYRVCQTAAPEFWAWDQSGHEELVGAIERKDRSAVHRALRQLHSEFARSVRNAVQRGEERLARYFVEFVPAACGK